MSNPLPSNPAATGEKAHLKRADALPTYWRPGDERDALVRELAAASDPDALLKLKIVQGLTGLGRSTIYDAIRAGRFPEPVRLSTRCSRWRAGEIRAWLTAHATAA